MVILPPPENTQILQNVGLADTKGKFKIISTSLSFQPGSALLLRVSK